MKKRYAILCLASIMVSATMFACSTTQNAATNVSGQTGDIDYEQLFAYNNNETENEVTNGKETSVNTISNLVGKQVKVGEDYYLTPAVFSYPASSEDEKKVYRAFRVENYDSDKYSIMFLFKNDSKIVEATDSEKSYIDPYYIVDEDYLNETNSVNFSNGAYAYKYNQKSMLILTSESGYGCSSIWGYDANKEEVYLIWYEPSAPGWSDYH